MSQATTAVNGDGQVFRILAERIGEFLPMDADGVRQIVDERLGDVQARVEAASGKLMSAIDERIQAATGKRYEVVTPQGTVTIDGAHAQFEEVLQLVREGHQNILLVGPAGSGKTTLGKDLAKALSLPFAFISLSAGVTESHLLGRVMPQADGAWKFEPSRFVQTYVNGGVFMLDEIDAADANVMVSINAALANGVLALPNGEIAHRHEQCFIVAAANTYGRGANAMYIGRNALDAATLDRFVLATVQVSYDEEWERRLVAGIPNGQKILDWVNGVRRIIESARLRRVASTRLVVATVKAIAGGAELSEAIVRYTRDWTADELAKLDAALRPEGV